MIANCCVIIGIRAKSFTNILTLNVLHFINPNTPKGLCQNLPL